mgnify:FL=1
MERLTTRDANCADPKTLYGVWVRNHDYISAANRLADYEDTELAPEEVTALGNLFDYALEESKTLTEQLELLKRLRELAEADREGRLVVLPCKVGDTVYRIFNPPSREPVISAHTLMSVDYIVRWIDKFGKTVFLTREEAEKALKTKEG